MQKKLVALIMVVLAVVFVQGTQVKAGGITEDTVSTVQHEFAKSTMYTVIELKISEEVATKIPEHEVGG